MGRAFTEQERHEVQERLRRTGLRLFSERGMRGVSVRDVTSEAGIAQGGFYTFYKSKDDFLLDLIEFRVGEKLSAAREGWEASLGNPAGYLAELFFREGMHLRQNKAFDNMISGTLEFFQRERGEFAKRISGVYLDFFEGLFSFWRSHGMQVDADVEMLRAVVRAAGLLVSSASLMDEGHFERIYRVFCDSQVGAFLRVGA